MELHWTKKLLHSKRDHWQIEKATNEWEEIIAYYISDED